MIEFQKFAKIPRLLRSCTITEKIDGTNGQVFIRPGTTSPHSGPVSSVISPYELEFGIDTQIEVDGVPALIRAGSRSRWLPSSGGKEDNHGFGAWVYQHAHELAGLGFGHHFGEWAGLGIQRGYGLREKRFYLFNTSRWGDDAAEVDGLHFNRTVRPACCHVVPVLYRGPFAFDTKRVDEALAHLTAYGSAIGEWVQAEGVVVFHEASGHLYKVTCEHDDEPKNATPPREHVPQKHDRVFDPNTTGRRTGCEGHTGPNRRAK